MMSGKELHRVLEAEVKEEEGVAVSSPEDAWALKLVDSIMCFRQLMKQGMTRETYVFGQLQVCNGARTLPSEVRAGPCNEIAYNCNAADSDIHISSRNPRRCAVYIQAISVGTGACGAEALYTSIAMLASHDAMLTRQAAKRF